MKKSWLLYPALIAGGLAADLISKSVIFDQYGYTLPPRHGAVPVIDGFFNIACRYNDKFAFSLGPDNPALVPVLHIAAFGVIGYLIYSLRHAGSTIRIALALIVAGAIGNLYDRMALGKVRDFLDVYVGTHHWPTFNVADSFVSVGATVIVVMLLFTDPTKKTQTKTKTKKVS